MRSARVLTVFGSATLLLLSGCSDAKLSREAIAESFAKEVSADGTEADLGCIKDAVAEFSDADMTVIDKAIRADSDLTKDLSGDGMEVLIEMMGCTSLESDGIAVPEAVEGLSTMQSLMYTEMLKSLNASGTSVDEDCLKQLVAGVDNEFLSDPAKAAELTSELGEQAASCITGG